MGWVSEGSVASPSQVILLAPVQVSQTGRSYSLPPNLVRPTP